MNKLKLSLSMYIFGSKIDSTPWKFIKIKNYFFWNVLFRKIYDPMGPVFQFYLCSPENFFNKFTLILLFFSTFYGQISCKPSKPIVDLRRAHFFLWEYIYFFLLRFFVLEIFDFKVFDLIEKMNEHATLNSNITKTTKGKK